MEHVPVLRPAQGGEGASRAATSAASTATSGGAGICRRVRRCHTSGGFGVTFHCTHAITGGAVAVKSLTESNLDQEVGAVLREATALEKLKHPAIIGLRDCGYADPVGKRRPYLVM